jgi:RNA polymerase sigma factor (sigma-70 family)
MTVAPPRVAQRFRDRGGLNRPDRGKTGSMPTVAERASEALATRPAQDASLGPWLSGDRDAAQGASAPSSERSKPLRALALLSDDRLAAHSARGDSGAFAELYRRHHQRLYRYCLTLLHDPDDAADVLQTTMAKALGALERGERVKGVRSWLFRIAHNTAIDLVRARHPQAPLDALEEIESSALTAPSAASQAQSRAEMAETVADIRGLPRRQQSALVMRELAALPYDEIAGALETSPLAARQLVHQARSALHDTRSGRDMDCETARQALGERDGRRPRDRRVRAHVAFCDACASFGQSIQERRAALTAFAPPLAPAAATEILGRLLGAGSTSSAGLAGGRRRRRRRPRRGLGGPRGNGLPSQTAAARPPRHVSARGTGQVRDVYGLRPVGLAPSRLEALLPG